MKLLNRRETAPKVNVPISRLVPQEARGVSISATDLLCCTVLFLLILVVFWKTVFLQLPISRIGLIAEWDSLFAALRKGVILQIDPSAVLLALPTYTTIAAHYHSGSIPLWNALNAFGSPLVGDIQATVFSPLRFLFNIWPTMQMYNLQLVAQVEIAALSTFFLCRRLNAGAVPSLCAALSYALCPFVLWYLELQSGVGYSLNPLVLWLFVRSAAVRSNKSALLAGFGAGCTILAGHPETSFFAIVFASLVTVMLSAPRWLDAIRLLGLAAAAAVCTCAPSFFPFLEFARNSDCYKYAVTESAYVPWQAILANFCTPVSGGASPFLGAFAASFALLSYSRERSRSFWAMTTVAGLCFILVAKLWPLSMVSAVPPFNYLITVYALPIFLVAISALAALGLTNIASSLASSNMLIRKGAVVGFMYTMGAVLCLPLIWNIVGSGWAMTNFDLTLATSNFHLASWMRDVVLTLIAVAVLAAALLRPKFAGLAVVALVLLNGISLLSVSRLSLPAQAKFELPRIAAMEFLRKSGERCLVVGTHLAKPDVNLLYGVDDVRSINAMLPPRYVEYIKACGASADQFTQWFGDQVTTAIDFGSVKYVLSQTPVTSLGDLPRSWTAVQPHEIGEIGGVIGGALTTDLDNLQTCGYVNWTLTSGRKLSVSICLVDLAGKVVWFSDRTPLTGRQEIRVPLPSQDIDQYSIQAQLFDVTNGQVVEATTENSGLVFIGPVPAKAIAVAPPRLKLVKQFDGGVRLYENLHVLPRAYMASSVVNVRTPEEALAKLSNPSFDRRTQVVLENDTMLPEASVPAASPGAVQILSRSGEEISLKCANNKTAVLVVTDTFYPGWKAFVDGKRARIVRANYLFRGVILPPGSHKVTMRYYPETFTVGVLLFVGFWTLALVGVLRKPKGRRRATKATTRELVANGARKAI